MKLALKSLFLVLFVTLFSCKDTKKAAVEVEEADAIETVKEIESIETEIDAAVNEVETKSEELENALNELDGI